MDKINQFDLDVLLRTSGPTIDELLDEFIENENEVFFNGTWHDLVLYAANEYEEQGVSPKELTWEAIRTKTNRMGIPEKLAKVDVYLSVSRGLIGELLFYPHCDDISKIKDLNKNVADNIRSDVESYIKDNDILLDALMRASDDNWTY